MPPIIKAALPVVGVLALIYIGFRINALLGIGIIIVIIAAGVFANRSIIYATRGNIAFSRGDEEQAIKLLEKAYKTKRAMPEHLAGYAYLLNKTGKVEEAAKLMKELLAKNLTDPMRLQASVSLATSYWLLGKQEEAYQLLQEFYPDMKSTKLYGTLGYYKLLRGEDLEETLAFNQEAYDYNSDDLTIVDNLAQNYYFLGRLEEAREMYEKVMEKNPRNADSYYFYALTLKGLGKLDEAREQVRKALDREFALISSLTKDDVERLAQELGVDQEE